MSRVRAFIAINLPISVVEAIREFQRQLADAAEKRGVKVGWVRPENLHVTIKFLGDLTEPAAFAVRDVLEQLLLHRPAPLVHVREVGAFPSAESPRVLWVGFKSDDGALLQIAKEVDEALAEHGHPAESRAFHPHVILGRVRQGSADLITELGEPDFGTCHIREVVLYKSDLGQAGARYTPLGAIALGA